MLEFRDGSVYTIDINDAPILHANTWYAIEISSNTEENQETMALMLTNSTNNENGKLFENGNLLDDQHISLKLWTRGIRN